jgi:hypothetical protein
MKVVKILDQYTYVIDSGTSNGVKKGQKCYIFVYGENITDPKTNVILGRLEIPKTYCTVIHAQKSISTIQSDEASSSYSRFVGAFTLKLNYNYFENSLTEETKKVKIGDEVNLVKENEFIAKKGYST